MVGFIVPPGGMAGFAQMTPASRLALSPGRTGSPRRRRTKAKSTRTRKTRGKRASGGGRKLKFGSPAFHKKYGAKMRRNAKKARG